MTETEHFKELYAHFGLTAYHGQCLEVEAGNALLYYVTVGNRIKDHSAIKAIDNSICRETLGSLLRIVRKVVAFDEEAIKVIEKALDRRNYLVHHFFREHSYDMLHQQGRERMIEELVEMRNDFAVADGLLSVITRAIAKHVGIDDQVINKLLEEKRAGLDAPPNAGSADAPPASVS